MTKLSELTDGAYTTLEGVIQQLTYQGTWASLSFATKEEKIDNIKFWNVTDSLKQALNEANDTLVVQATFRRKDYKGNKAYVMNGFDIVKNAKKVDFLPHSYWTESENSAFMRDAFNAIKDSPYYDLVRYCYKEVDREVNNNLQAFPAAIGMHHSEVGGLYTHTLSMFKTAQAYLALPQYANLDGNILLPAVLLHDLGKALTYTNAYDHEANLTENLIEHICVMDSLIVYYYGVIKQRPAYDINHATDILTIRHMILAHHGKQEWGSPVQPALPEALLLHNIDICDGKMEMVRTTMNSLKDGETSDKVFGLEKARLCKYQYPKSSTNDNSLPDQNQE